jgi:hypothetical protein
MWSTPLCQPSHSSWVHHNRTVRLVDRTTSSPLSWLHHLTTSDALSDVPWVLGKDGNHMYPSLSCNVGGLGQWNSTVVHAVIWSLTLLHWSKTCHKSGWTLWIHCLQVLQHLLFSAVKDWITAHFIPRWHHLLTLHHFHSCNSEICSGRTETSHRSVG